MPIGPDVASVDGLGLSPSWNPATMAFVGLRASYGTAPDSKYASYAAQLKALGIPSFGYVFLRFGDNVGTPEAQVDTAMSVIGTPDKNAFVPCVDLEMSGKRPDGWDPSKTLDWFLRAWRHMTQLCGAKAGIYTSEVVWVDPAQMSNPTCDDIKDAWSWTKYWPFATRTQAIDNPARVEALPAPKVAPPFGGAWALQQYQGDALGYQGFIGTCDLNRSNTVKYSDHNGTVAWLQRKLGVPSDGSFGPITEQAVKTYQAANQLKATGIVDLSTMMRMSWL